MPPRTPLSTPLRAWRCPQCKTRSFTTVQHLQGIGPEHPRYVPFYQPPQQTAPENKFVKGNLPVPRDIFARAHGQNKASDKWLKQVTKEPKKRHPFDSGSREEWKAEVSNMRRVNLREGLKSLRQRKASVEQKRKAISEQKQAHREGLVRAQEKEDERLTTPSHGLDLHALLKGPLLDPTREARLAHKKRNYVTHEAKREGKRAEALNELFLHARTFIVNEQQLDKAVDEAFGTDEKPVIFGDAYSENRNSVWGLGVPSTVQDIMNRTNRQGSSRSALGAASDTSAIQRERITRIAEVLTGGKMAEKRD